MCSQGAELALNEAVECSNIPTSFISRQGLIALPLDRYRSPHEGVEQRHGEIGLAIAGGVDHALGDQ